MYLLVNFMIKLSMLQDLIQVSRIENQKKLSSGP